MIAQQEIQKLYFSGKRSDYDHLPLAGRLFVRYIVLPVQRFAYFMWAWSNDIESQCICTTRERAVRFASSHKRGFFQELPVDVDLPDEPCQFGEHDFPNSEASPKYQGRSFSLVTVDRRLLKRGKRAAQQMFKRLDGK